MAATAKYMEVMNDQLLCAAPNTMPTTSQAKNAAKMCMALLWSSTHMRHVWVVRFFALT